MRALTVWRHGLFREWEVMGLGAAASITWRDLRQVGQPRQADARIRRIRGRQNGRRGSGRGRRRGRMGRNGRMGDLMRQMMLLLLLLLLLLLSRRRGGRSSHCRRRHWREAEPRIEVGRGGGGSGSLGRLQERGKWDWQRKPWQRTRTS